ncbi:MAG: heat-inducible transcriptional repressor HrcA [bacterium]
MFQAVSLSDREKKVLRLIIQHFVLTANPVGSRHLARHGKLGLSPATIRNVMADLEERGLLSHPHTSAGRLPTDLGYRVYVNQLMETTELSAREKESIEQVFEEVSGELDEILIVTARVLSQLSKLLGIVLAPSLSEGVLDRIDIVRIAEGRALIVIAVRLGPVRTILAEISQILTDEQVQRIARELNARLAGLTLEQVKNEIAARVGDLPEGRTELVRFFVDSAEKLFTFAAPQDLRIGPTAQVIAQPEFANAKSLRGIIELIEDRDIVVHLLTTPTGEEEKVHVAIGGENPERRARSLSVLTSHYEASGVRGALGIIGPTRMNYPRLVSLVDYTAKTVAKHLKRES